MFLPWEKPIAPPNGAVMEVSAGRYLEVLVVVPGVDPTPQATDPLGTGTIFHGPMAYTFVRDSAAAIVFYRVFDKNLLEAEVQIPGPQGPQGIQGNPGPQGPAGSDASIPEASVADYLDGADQKYLAPATAWASAAETVLTYAPTIAPDFSTGYNFQVTLTGDLVLENPQNVKRQAGHVRIVQDSAGGHAISYGSSWVSAGGVRPTLSTAAGAVDVLYYKVLTPTEIEFTLSKGVA